MSLIQYGWWLVCSPDLQLRRVVSMNIVCYLQQFWSLSFVYKCKDPYATTQLFFVMGKGRNGASRPRQQWECKHTLAGPKKERKQTSLVCSLFSVRVTILFLVKKQNKTTWGHKAGHEHHRAASTSPDKWPWVYPLWGQTSRLPRRDFLRITSAGN